MLKDAAYGAVLAIAAYLAWQAPGASRRPTREAALGVIVVWLLCLWSTLEVTPAQLIADHSGILVDPYAIWALQDTVLALFLIARFATYRKPVQAIVALSLSVQVYLYGIRGQIGGVFAFALDALFLTQLLAIAWEGGGVVRERIRNCSARGPLFRLGAGWGRNVGAACASCEGCPVGRCLARGIAIRGL